MTSVISIKNLSIGYSQKSIAQEISLELSKGELVGVVGINGIGKSTLLRTIAKLQPSITGEISILGNPLEDISYSALSRMCALVLTEPLATRNLTVEELIALGRQPHTNWLGSLTPEDYAQMELGISQFHLQKIRTKKCFELSDGQLQRTLIARAMVQDTPLIFLDEPTTHLDLANKVQILKLLQHLSHQHGKTVVFTTHEIDLAIQLCDKILILNGQNNPFGEPSQLVESGEFSKLFSPELVQFDVQTQRFKIRQ